jgi:hypothetical protein
MNDAFLAMQHRDELMDTLYFAGFDHQYSKDTVGGKKSYVFRTDKFNLTVQGRNIIINDAKFKNVRDAKRYICERFVR